MIDDVTTLRRSSKLSDPRELARALGLEQGMQRQSRGVLVRCPNHDEKNASCSVIVGADGTVQCRCHACGWSADALGLVAKVNGLDTDRDFPRVKEIAAQIAGVALEPYAKAERKIVAEYDYTTAEGALLYQVVRFDPKDFRQRKPDGAGGWEWKLNGVARVLYHLPELLAADADRTVYVVEGEKDVRALESIGLLATTHAGGAGKWSSVADLAREVLRGRFVVIIADKDEPGRKHALEVAKSLQGFSRTRIVEVEHGKDAHDAIALHGATAATFEQLVTAAELAEEREAIAQAAEPDALPPDPEAPVRLAEPTDDRARIVWARDFNVVETETPWLCEGLMLAPGRPNVVAGEGGSNKTMLAQYLACCVVTGRGVFGRWPVKEGRVLHVDYEQGLKLTRRRYNRFAYAMGYPLGAHEWDDRLGFLARPFFLDHADQEKRLATLVKGFDLVIVDSTRRSAPKLRENDPEAALPLEVMFAVSEATGVVFLATDHATTKVPENDGRGGKGQGRRRKAIQRGHSSKLDAAGTLIALTKEGKGLSTLVSCEREQQEGEEFEDFAFDVQDIENPNEPEPEYGSPRESKQHKAWRKWGLKLVEMGTEATTKYAAQKPKTETPFELEARVESAAQRVLETVLKNPGISSKELEKLCGKMQDKLFDAAKNRLVRTGRIVNRTNKKTITEWIGAVPTSAQGAHP